MDCQKKESNMEIEKKKRKMCKYELSKLFYKSPTSLTCTITVA